MDYKELIAESISFLDDATKRSNELLKSVTRSSIKLQLEREIEGYSKMKGFWDQEQKRMKMSQEYSKDWDNTL